MFTRRTLMLASLMLGLGLLNAGTVTAGIVWQPQAGLPQVPAPPTTYTGTVTYIPGAPGVYSITSTGPVAGTLRITSDEPTLSAAELHALDRAAWEGDADNSVVVAVDSSANLRQVESVDSGGTVTHTFTGTVTHNSGSPGSYTVVTGSGGSFSVEETNASLSSSELASLYRAAWEGDADNSVVVSLNASNVEEVDSVATGGTVTHEFVGVVTFASGNPGTYTITTSGSNSFSVLTSDPSLSAPESAALYRANWEADVDNSIVVSLNASNVEEVDSVATGGTVTRTFTGTVAYTSGNPGTYTITTSSATTFAVATDDPSISGVESGALWRSASEGDDDNSVVVSLNANNVEEVDLASSGVFHGGLGCDYFDATSGSVSVSLPADFFASGSEAYTGTIALVGENLGTRGPWELGTTDVVFARRTEIVMGLPPSALDVAVKAMIVSLVGTAQLAIDVNGATQYWMVSVGLDDTAGPFPYGTMSLSRSGSDQGSWTLTLPVSPVVTFERSGVTKSHALGEVTLTCSNGLWSPRSGAATTALAATDLPIGLALGGTLSGSVFAVTLSPAGVDSAAPGPASIGSGVTIDATAKLGRGCTIGDGATIDGGVVVGPGCTVGAGAHLRTNSLLAGGASVGDDSDIGERSFLSNNSQVGAGCALGADCYLGRASTVGDNSTVGGGCQIERSCTLSASVTVGDNVHLWGGVSIGASASVDAGIEIAPGAVIAPQTAVTSSILVYEKLDGTTGVAAVGSEPANAVFLGTVNAYEEPVGISAIVEQDIMDPENPPEGFDIEKLKDDIGTDVARPGPGFGGTGDPYLEDVHDCEDFAEELRTKLAGPLYGYSTTFTIIRYVIRNPDYHPERPRRDPEWILNPDRTTHCLVDIHFGGEVLWLEAQRTGHGGALNPRDPKDRDSPPDDKIGTADRPGIAPTEGTDMRVESYPSQAAAQAAGATWD